MDVATSSGRGGSRDRLHAAHACCGPPTHVVHIGFQAGQLLQRVRMGVQPETIKVPVQMHSGQEDSMKGLSDPEVRTTLLADQDLCFLKCSVRTTDTYCKSRGCKYWRQ